MRRALIPVLVAPFLIACGAESIAIPSATLTEVEWRLQAFELSDGSRTEGVNEAGLLKGSS